MPTNSKSLDLKEKKGSKLFYLFLTILIVFSFFLVFLAGYYAANHKNELKNLIGWNISSSGAKKSCEYNGKTYKDGESFEDKDGCNTCGCADGQIACTLMACQQSSSSSISSLSSSMTSEKASNTAAIYFAKLNNPMKSGELSPLKSVNRTLNSTTAQTNYEYAISQLIVGPNQTEKDSGLFATFSLSGGSNCSGKDFQVAVNTIAFQTQKISVKFCKDIYAIQDSNIDGAWAGISLSLGGRVIEAIQKSLSFSKIENIEIRDKNGKCYMIESGVNKYCVD